MENFHPHLGSTVPNAWCQLRHQTTSNADVHGDVTSKNDDLIEWNRMGYNGDIMGTVLDILHGISCGYSELIDISWYFPSVSSNMETPRTTCSFRWEK